MAELVLVRIKDTKSPLRRRALVSQLRQTALASLPGDGQRIKVGQINNARFKLDLPTAEGTVDADGIFLDLHELDFDTLSLIYELAKAGEMAMVDSWGPSSTILFDRAGFKSLPPEFRRPKPALATSAQHLARMLGVSTRKPPAPTQTKSKKHQWSNQHDNRSRGRIPGLIEIPDQPQIYVQTSPDEDLQLMLKRFNQFLREKKLKVPKGGGIWPTDWQLRLPTGEIFINWGITGYEHRVNADHLVPANIQSWLKLARAFARHTHRKTATIENAKTLLLDTGRRYPLTKVESRLASDDES